MNAIGITDEQCAKLTEKLNQLLADYMMFYQNSRGLHWNIRGEKFFELHLKFEELYTNLLLKVDEVAERILTLGGTPLHTFDDYRALSSIKAVKNVSSAPEAVRSILEAFQVIIPAQRALLSLASDADDEGTNALMSDYIREQEKLVWMYSAYINK
jgi:starvation-inducible DNA-binding protein